LVSFVGTIAGDAVVDDEAGDAFATEEFGDRFAFVFVGEDAVAAAGEDGECVAGGVFWVGREYLHGGAAGFRDAHGVDYDESFVGVVVGEAGDFI
jgi:hypothetical protein